MLHLKRIQHPNEMLKCKVSGEKIYPGDYYYEDDEDGMIVRADIYRQAIREKKEKEWDYTKLNIAESVRDYEEQLKEYEKNYLASTLLQRETVIQKKGGY